jgi:folate-binding protein YgfZ
LTDKTYILLERRGLLSVSGKDAREFLQGLVSNDVTKVSPKRAIYAAFLTPQGKYLHDFFMIERDGAIFLDSEASRIDDLKSRLERYKLRSDVTLELPDPQCVVIALMGDGALQMFGSSAAPGTAVAFGGGVAFVDPRLAEIGARAILPRDTAIAELETAGFAPGPTSVYEATRLTLGLPDGSRDIEIEKAGLLESGFDELNGIDWKKGCYLGQELTARTKYRGLVKRRLVPIEIDGPLPESGTDIRLNGERVGEMRSGTDRHGIALLRLDAFEKSAAGGNFKAGNTVLTPHKPDWAEF